MNIRAFTLLVGCTLFIVGCKRDPAVPSGSFHLSVQSIVTDGDLKVSLIKYRLPESTSVYVDSEHSHGWVSMQDSPTPGKTGQRDGQLILSASRVARVGEAFASIQTLIRLETDHASAGGPAVNYVPAATNLDAYFSVSATTGDYKLDTPIEIGRLDGKPVTLLVSQSAKHN
jgi:hypothetical protein